MTTKEFIAKIADGTFSKNDVIMQSAQFPDKEDLLWDLKLADKVCLESTGKPQITDEAQITRISNAISWLSEMYERDSPGESNLPPELANNPLAMELLEKCKEAGLLDENYMPKLSMTPGKLGTTEWQKKEIASNITWLCDLRPKHKWEPFKTYWRSPYIDKPKTPNLSKPENVNRAFMQRKKVVDEVFAPYVEKKNKEIAQNHSNL